MGAGHSLSRSRGTTLVAVLVLAFLLVPTIIVVPVSFGSEKYLRFPPKTWSLAWYQAYFDDPEWMSATLLSVLVAFMATIVATLIVVPGTIAFERGRLPGRALIRGLVLAPMILPHIVIAVAMYIAFSRWGLIGTLAGFVAAHAVLCVPFLFLTLSAAVVKLDSSLELAAAGLGASRWATFRHVTFPLLLPAMAGGMAFAFITSLDEAVVSSFLSSSTSKTLMKKMFEDIDFDVSPIVAAVSTIVTAASLCLVALSQLVLRLRGRPR